MSTVVASTPGNDGAEITSPATGLADTRPIADVPHDAQAIERNSYERFRRGILRALYEGRFAPGQRLVEADLIRQFGVGRGTIREVFNSLAFEGVVTLVPHRGASVHMLSRGEVNQLLDVVAIMFGLAARRATEQIREDPAKTFRLLNAFKQLPDFEWEDDFTAFVEAREHFHRTVMQLSGNNELIRFFPSGKVHIMRLQLRPFQRAADGLEVSDYKLITEAILSGDPDLAEAVARDHVQHTVQNVSSVPDRAFERDRWGPAQGGS